MTVSLVLRALFVAVTGTTVVGPGLPAQEVWQTDWSAFQDAIAAWLRNWASSTELPPGWTPYAGKTVTWRGVLASKSLAGDLSHVTVRMPERMVRLANETVAMNGVRIFPKSPAQWDQLQNGAEVQFRGVTSYYTPFTLIWKSGDQYKSLQPNLLNGEVLAVLAPETTVQSNPPGRRFSVTGAGCGPSGPFTTPRTFSWQGANCTVSFLSPDASSADTRYVFQRWDDGVAANPRTFAAPSSSAAYAANFTAQYLLTVQVSPAGTGTVSVSPSTPDGYYNSGTSVQVAATAGSGYQFSGWTGDLTGASSPRSLTMSGPRSITAKFITDPRAMIAVVSAASYRQDSALAPDSIAALFGTGLASGTESAAKTPLPTTLAGATVRVRDSRGSERVAPLFFVSPQQINFLIPAQTTLGLATITVDSPGGQKGPATVMIESVAPGIISADGSGSGIAAGTVVKAESDGSQFHFPLARLNDATARLVPVPVNFGSESQAVVLTLYGTGIRARSSLSAVSVKVGNIACELLYAGAQSTYAGLDQVNVRLPRSLAGAGDVQIDVVVDGKAANPVKLVVGQTHLPPSITAVIPDTLVAAAGPTAVAILGRDLTDVTKAVITPPWGITIDDPKVSNERVEVTVFLAAGSDTGQREIYLVTPRGNTNRLPITIRLSPPVIQTVAPSSLQQGAWQTVAVSGENLFDPRVAVEIAPSTGIRTFLAGVQQAPGKPPEAVAKVWAEASAAVGDRSISVVTSGGRSNSLPFSILPKTGQFTIMVGGMARVDNLAGPVLTFDVYLSDLSGAAASDKVRYVVEVPNRHVIFGEDTDKAYPLNDRQYPYYRTLFVFLPSTLSPGTKFRVTLMNSLDHPSNVAEGTTAL